MQIRSDASSIAQTPVARPKAAAPTEAPIQETRATAQSSEVPGLMKPVKFETTAPPAPAPPSMPSATFKIGKGPVDLDLQERLLKALTSKGEPIPSSTTIIVMGAESDNVMNRTPGRSLAMMAEQGMLDPAQGHQVILTDRVPISNADYLKKFETGDAGHSLPVNKNELAKFAAVTGLNGDAPAVQMVEAGKTADFDKLKGLTANAQNILFFVSLPPFLAGSVLTSIADSGIGRAPGQSLKIIQEKPFGTDLKSAHDLANLIDTKFQPGEVLNIDHFNGYPGTLNSLLHRLDPAVDSVLNNKHVDDIHVILQEEVKSNDRKAFRGMGIVTDMQGHALQTAATILSDYPKGESLTGETVQKAKDAFIDHYKIVPGTVSHGQFEGFNDPAQGAPADAPASDADTLEKSSFTIKNDRWAGVPAHTTLLKGSNATKFGVDLHLKSLTPEMAGKLGVAADTKGTLTFEIHPHDTVSFTPDGGEKITLPFHDEVGTNPPYVPFFVSAANNNPAPFVSSAAAVAGWDSVTDIAKDSATKPSLKYPVGASLADIQKLTDNPPASA